MKMKTAKAKKTNSIKKPLREKDLPVTKRLLDLKFAEVKGDVTTLRLEMKAGFTSVDARFANVDARFANVDARFTSVDAQFDKMDAKLSSMETKLTKMLVILEEQNDRNRAALDGYAIVYEKFTDTEERLNKLEVHSFGAKQR